MVVDCLTVVKTCNLWVQQTVRTCRCLLAQGCKWHKPDGCSGRLHCPFCLILPGLTILRKISNHLDLIKGEQALLYHFPVSHHLTSASAICQGNGPPRRDARQRQWLGAANPEECGQDARKLQRQEEVADLVLGPDADQVGGLRRDKTFLTISDTRGCGKLLVLEKLLSLWSQPGMDNKVTQPDSRSLSATPGLHPQLPGPSRSCSQGPCPTKEAGL